MVRDSEAVLGKSDLRLLAEDGSGIKIQSVEFAVASVQSGLSMAMVQRLRFRVPAIWLRQATQGRRDDCW